VLAGDGFDSFRGRGSGLQHKIRTAKRALERVLDGRFVVHNQKSRHGEKVTRDKVS